jgi:hypothetical protein
VFFQRAFELAVVSDKASKANGDDPVIDFLLEEGEATLVLSVSIMNGIWKPEFLFSMLPVGLDKMDVLEAKLRDAQEEIEAMRINNNKEKEVLFLSLSSNVACQAQLMVVWDVNNSRITFPAGFKLSADNTQVGIMKAGLYQVHVRFGGHGRGSGTLRLNEVDIAQCLCSGDPTSQCNTAQITELKYLRVDDRLQVRCEFRGGAQVGQLYNCFSFLYLGK